MPPGTSPSGRDVHWEIRGYVDIEWAYDIPAASQITVRNLDIEKIRDALGALDYRLAELDPEPLGKRFTGKFQPPVQARKDFGITDINLAVEYLGANLQLTREVEKTSLFKFDKQTSWCSSWPSSGCRGTQQLSQVPERQDRRAHGPHRGAGPDAATPPASRARGGDAVRATRSARSGAGG